MHATVASRNLTKNSPRNSGLFHWENDGEAGVLSRLSSWLIRKGAKMHPVCWIDTETTGLDAKRHGIVQVAGIIESCGAENISFNYMVQPFPEDEVEDKALEVSRITRDRLQTFASPRDVHADLIKIFSGVVDRFDKHSKMLFAGYNAGFDMDFMRAFFTKSGDKFFGSWFWWPPIDVAILAGDALRDERHKIPNFKLGTVAEYLGILPKGDLHDAYTDIILTRDVYMTLVNGGQK